MPAASEAAATRRGSDDPLQRGTPPGSLRYFSVLFAPVAARPLLHALYAFEAEIRDTVTASSHDIAHTRLQWWRGEVDRLVAGQPQHPVTRALLGLKQSVSADPTLLHEMLVAADLDLARMTYASTSELEAYCFRASGSLQTLAAAAIAGPRPLSVSEREFARELGAVLRQSEMLRDLRRDVAAGRLYMSLDSLAATGVDVSDLQRNEWPAGLVPAVSAWMSDVAERLARLPMILPAGERTTQRPGLVLAALHQRLLARLSPAVGCRAEPVDLPPFTRLWTAWRTAVRYG